MSFKVALLIVGDEILYGQTQDTNSFFIAKECNEKGLDLGEILVVKDDEVEMYEALERLSKNNQVIITSGGLGPTKDDKTKKVMSQLLGTSLVINHQALVWVKNYCKKRNLSFNELNQKQAELPQKSIPIKNEIGTACGVLSEYNGVFVFNLPGVPVELKKLFKTKVLPMIESKLLLQPVIHQFVYTKNFPESELSLLLEELESNTPQHIKWAYLPTRNRVEIRLTTTERYREEVLILKNKIEKILPDKNKSIFSNWIEEIDALLKDKHKTISCAESFTAGSLASIFTKTPGSSRYFKAGVVAYAPEMKIKLLQVSKDLVEAQGMVNEQVAIQMAENLRLMAKTDFSVSTTGVAGPDSDDFGNEVGTAWVAIASKKETKTYFFHIKNETRENFVQAITTEVLMKLYSFLQENIN